MASANYPAIHPNFLGLEPSSYSDAEVVVLPVPYDSTTSYKAGSRHGPAAILEASHQVETYDEETGADWSGVGIYTLPEVEPDMRGPAAMMERIAQAAKPVVEDGKFLITLGGEHSVSLAPIRACAEKYPNLSVLQIDAHLDLRNTYEGTPFSHASVMRRVSDFANVVPVGIRNVSEEEADYVASENLRVFYAQEIVGRSNWELQVLDQLKENVYITVDVDGFDPSVVPATGTPEPGGLGWWEALRLFRLVAKQRNVVGFDITELCPMPPYHSSEFACARLMYKLMGYIFQSRTGQGRIESE